MQEQVGNESGPVERHPRFNAIVLETIETVLPGIAALYIIFGGLHSVALTTEAGTGFALAVCSVASGCLFLSVCWLVAVLSVVLLGWISVS